MLSHTSQKHDAAHVLINNAGHYRRFEEARRWTESYMNEAFGTGAAFRIPEKKDFYRGPGAQSRGDTAEPEGSESDGDLSDEG